MSQASFSSWQEVGSWHHQARGGGFTILGLRLSHQLTSHKLEKQRPPEVQCPVQDPQELSTTR